MSEPQANTNTSTSRALSLSSKDESEQSEAEASSPSEEDSEDEEPVFYYETPKHDLSAATYDTIFQSGFREGMTKIFDPKHNKGMNGEGGIDTTKKEYACGRLPKPRTKPDASVSPVEAYRQGFNLAVAIVILEEGSRDASAAAETVKNHPFTQSVTNGPVASNIKDQHAKTTAEFSNLAAARTTPTQPAATGQQLTHYHSFFTSLLSWDNPRASGIAYLTTVLFIFAARYFNILRYGFKLTWMTLGITILAEVVGKAALGRGLSSQIRPKKYFTISKATLDNLTSDLHELINFFVIESQRIVFAENVFVSIAAFLGAFLSYYLIKIVPVWGLTLISTSVLFLAPLVYKTNKELIDHHITNISNVVNQQTEQVKTLAAHHASAAAETTKQYVGDYSAKAQEYIGNARGTSRSTSPVATTKHATTTPAFKTENFSVALNKPVSSSPVFKTEDFPVAPKDEFKSAPPVQETVSALKPENEPLIST